MENIKNKSFNLLNLLLFISSIMAVIATTRFTYLHIIMYPVPISFYPQAIILFISILALLIFTIRYKTKYLGGIIIITISLCIFNLIGFNIITNLLGW